MYMYDSDKDMYVFAGDLTQYLLEYGVAEEHIEKMKCKKLQRNRDAYQNYPATDSVERDYEQFDISFKDEMGVFEVRGYEGPENGENMFDYLDKLSQVINRDLKYVSMIKRMPVVIRKIILYSKKSYRIGQYLKKKYLTDDEQIFWNYREPVILYLL